ncbi:MAG: fused MFS/spermidine synthase [Planctomycetes bacterium]|nr:fused MFS/spermidine synthase [Planctomycetota bacterium]
MTTGPSVDQIKTVKGKFLLLRVTLLVFFAGAALMALEIVGSRLVAPWYGSSIYVWGSLIGIFLGAMSVGYFAGGWLSHERPSQTLINLLQVVAGLWITSLPYWAADTCMGTASLGLAYGPLAACTVLFGVPSILIGMVSPFSVQLLTSEIRAVGKVAGKLYGLSTIGSIAGTLITTFALIPNLDHHVVIIIIGAVLIGAALLTLPFDRMFAGASAITAFALLGVHQDDIDNVFDLDVGDIAIVDQKDSAYHEVAIVSQKGGDEYYRALRFSGNIDSTGKRSYGFTESRVLWTAPGEKQDEDFVAYSRTRYTYLFHLAMLYCPMPKSALFVGCGGGVGPMSFQRAYTADALERQAKFQMDSHPLVTSESVESKKFADMEIDVIEIDPVVVDFAKKYMGLKPGSNMRIRTDDGRRFLLDEPEKKYDLIFLDAYTVGGRLPHHLLTKEYLELLKTHLTENGVIVSNVIGSYLGGYARILLSEFITFRSVFEQVEMYSSEFPTPSEKTAYEFKNPSQWHVTLEPRNVMLIAPNKKVAMGDGEYEAVANNWLRFLATLDQKEFGNTRFFDFREFAMRRISDADANFLVNKAEKIYVLTDAFAPVDTMPF